MHNHGLEFVTLSQFRAHFLPYTLQRLNKTSPLGEVSWWYQSLQRSLIVFGILVP